MERAKGFEPSTPTLARLCSTPELRPPNDVLGVSMRPASPLQAQFSLPRLTPRLVTNHPARNAHTAQAARICPQMVRPAGLEPATERL